MEHVISTAPASHRRRKLRWLPFVSPGVVLFLTVWIWMVHDQPIYDHGFNPAEEGISREWACRQDYILLTSLGMYAAGTLALVAWLRRNRPWYHLIWEVPYFALGLCLANLLPGFL